MTSMKATVFNTSRHVFVTSAGGVIGPFETATVDAADPRVLAGIGDLRLSVVEAPQDVDAELPEAPLEEDDAPEPGPVPEPASSRKNRTRPSEPEA